MILEKRLKSNTLDHDELVYCLLSSKEFSYSKFMEVIGSPKSVLFLDLITDIFDRRSPTLKQFAVRFPEVALRNYHFDDI